MVTEGLDIFPVVKVCAESLGIRTIVVASTSDATGFKVVEMFRGYNVIVVTYSYGFKEKDRTELLPEYREKIIAAGGRF